MIVDTRDLFVSSLLLRDLAYEEFETALFKRAIHPGSVVVDVGAQIGYYSVLAASICGDSGQVLSFEPDSHNFGLLAANLHINGFKTATATNKAVTDKAESRQFFIDNYNLGKHSLALSNVTSIDRDAKSSFTETVALDVFLAERQQDRVDVLKVDAEGAEGLVIRGCQRTLERNSAVLFIELWPFGQRNLGTDPREMLLSLKSLGYDAYLIDEASRTTERIESTSELFATDSPRESFNLLFRKAS